MLFIYIDKLDPESVEVIKLAFQSSSYFFLDEKLIQQKKNIPNFQKGVIFSFDFNQANLSLSKLRDIFGEAIECHLIGVYSTKAFQSNRLKSDEWDDIIFSPFSPEEVRYRVGRLYKHEFSPEVVREIFEQINYREPMGSLLEWVKSRLGADALFLLEKCKAGFQVREHLSTINSLNKNWIFPSDCGLELNSDEAEIYGNPDTPLLIYLKSFLNRPYQYLVKFHLRRYQADFFLLALWEKEPEALNEIHSGLRGWVELLKGMLPIILKLEAMANSIGERRDFLVSLINRLNFGIMVTDQQNRIRFINQPAADILMKRAQELLGRDVEAVFGKNNFNTLFRIDPEQTGIYERPELEFVASDGEKITVGFTRSPFKFPDTAENGFIFSLKDITYSKELQEEMRRIDRLASLGVMASGIAHEIRNPLAGIKAIAQTFEEELEPDDPKQEFVKRIIRQVNRLDDMLKTLFSYAKPQKPNPAKCAIQPILTEVLMLQKQKLLKHAIRLQEYYEENLPYLFIDSGQIQQVLFNLILNSIEAIDNKGEISIRVSRVGEVTQIFKRKPFYKKVTEKPYVQIQISDTGKGIEPKDLNQIFNPFFTTKTFGTGLGLSIVYQITKENDGVIYFESEAGKGTDCYLFLPAYVDKSDEQE